MTSVMWPLSLKYEKDCGEMLVEEGLMDRELGTKQLGSRNKGLYPKVSHGKSR